jgi:hypothetical protein
MKTLSVIVFQFLLFIMALVLISCEEKFIRDKESHLINPANRQWLIDTTLYPEFLLADSLDNLEKYLFDNQQKTFSVRNTSEGLFGLYGNEYDEYEHVNQEYISLTNESFRIVIGANDPPDGDGLSVRLKDIIFSYDLSKKKLTAFRTNEGQRPDSDIINGKFTELPMESQVIRYDTLNIDDKRYTNALEFILKDFEEQWSATTIVSIIIVKEIGLLQYRLNNGITFCRVPK